MCKKLKLTTSKGTFQVFSNKMPDNDIFVASVLYYVRGPKDPQVYGDLGSMEFELHNEYRSTEKSAMSALENWCQNTFGDSCVFSQVSD